MGKGNQPREGKSNIKGDKGDIKHFKKDKKSIPESTKTLRVLYNKLMQKDKKDKTEIVKRVIKEIDDKYSDICFKHDGCRVLQGSLKYGNNDQRRILVDKLIPLLFDIIIGKYSIYLSTKVFKYADNSQKDKILETIIKPNFKKLLKFSGGITFFKYVFLNSTNAFQETLVDLYIKDYFKIPLEKVKLLTSSMEVEKEEEEKEETKNIIVEQTETAEVEKIRELLKAHIEKQLELGINKNFIFHGFLNKIFDFLDEKTQIYISELFDDDFLPFLDSNFGFELACKIYSISSAKTRKKIIKAIREKTNEMFANENNIYFITKIILFTDDTKIIEKNFLKLIMEKLDESLSSNISLLKIIWNILFPFNKKCNNNSYQKILSYERPYSNKKELEKRQNELIEPIYEPLCKIVSYEARLLMTDVLYSIFFVDFISFLIKRGDIEKIEALLNHIISLVDIDIKSNSDTIENCFLNDKVGHGSIKRILKELQNAEGEVKKYELSFNEKLVKLMKTNLEGFLNNKGIFIIVQIVENEATKHLLLGDLEKFKGDIMKNKNNKKLAGMMILAKILEK